MQSNEMWCVPDTKKCMGWSRDLQKTFRNSSSSSFAAIKSFAGDTRLIFPDCFNSLQKCNSKSILNARNF